MSALKNRTRSAVARSENVEALAAANAALLRQARDLVARLDRAAYAAPPEGLAKSGPGAHVRHCLDVADCLLAGVEAGRVDYTARSRDARTAEDPIVGAERLERTARALETCGEIWRGSTGLLVRSEETDDGDDPGAWAPSSVARELQHLLEHTTHHFAMLALLLRLRGVDPGESFGVAPSTLAYWRTRFGGGSSC